MENKEENKDTTYLADCNICIIKQDEYYGSTEVLTVSPNCKTHRFHNRFGTRTKFHSAQGLNSVINSQYRNCRSVLPKIWFKFFYKKYPCKICGKRYILSTISFPQKFNIIFQTDYKKSCKIHKYYQQSADRWITPRGQKSPK